MRQLLLAPVLLAAAAPFGAVAEPARCVPAQAVVPPFNATPEALEQARFAATAVMAERAGRGEATVAICRTDAVAPLISEVAGIEDRPLGPEEAAAAETDPAG